MKIDVKLWYNLQFLPTRRHRKSRTAVLSEMVDVEIREMTEETFPVAFIVKDYQSVYEGAKQRDDFKGNGDFVIFPEEVRSDGTTLYTPERVGWGSAISTEFKKMDWLQNKLQLRNPCIPAANDLFSDKSIVIHSSFEDEKNRLQQKASDYVLYDGKIWSKCGEPRYVVMTFGLGHNHGGTALMLSYGYNPNISSKCYFSALKKKEALEAARSTAIRRGDSESVSEFDPANFKKDIEVLLPEMVKVNPSKEAGPGDPFLNELKVITEASESILEAGLLSILATKAAR